MYLVLEVALRGWCFIIVFCGVGNVCGLVESELRIYRRNAIP